MHGCRLTYNERSRRNPFCPVDWRWQTADKIAPCDDHNTCDTEYGGDEINRLVTRQGDGPRQAKHKHEEL